MSVDLMADIDLLGFDLFEDDLEELGVDDTGGQVDTCPTQTEKATGSKRLLKQDKLRIIRKIKQVKSVDIVEQMIQTLSNELHLHEYPARGDLLSSLIA